MISAATVVLHMCGMNFSVSHYTVWLGKGDSPTDVRRPAGVMLVFVCTVPRRASELEACGVAYGTCSMSLPGDESRTVICSVLQQFQCNCSDSIIVTPWISRHPNDRQVIEGCKHAEAVTLKPTMVSVSPLLLSVVAGVCAIALPNLYKQWAAQKAAGPLERYPVVQVTPEVYKSPILWKQLGGLLNVDVAAFLIKGAGSEYILVDTGVPGDEHEQAMLASIGNATKDGQLKLIIREAFSQQLMWGYFNSFCLAAS